LDAGALDPDQRFGSDRRSWATKLGPGCPRVLESRAPTPGTARLAQSGSGVIVLLMGVAGAGKTAVGERLAKRQGWAFVDADDLHPPGNVRKMSAGVPLTDEDRLPWLRRVHAVMLEHAGAGHSAVVACSALKRQYRDLLLEGLADARLVYLRGTPAVFARRLSRRRGHFFDPSLLASQLETLEEPVHAVIVDADEPLDAVVDTVAAAL
jgi:gluconokinase